MNRIINYTITTQHTNVKLHEYLRELGYSSAILTKLRQDSHLSLINGEPSFLNTPLNSGDKVTISIIEEHPSQKIPAVELPFNVVYEDEDIVVINKPAKMPIHPSLNNYENTLGNAAAYYYRDEQSPFVYRCVNRLDRDTTGLTIIAKNMLSGSILAYKDNYSSIKKTYYAIVCNNANLQVTNLRNCYSDNSVTTTKMNEVIDNYSILKVNDLQTINFPISRKVNSTIERCVNFENGENAVTHFEVLDVKDNLAFIKLNLETGRTHQIRVHMASIGHPLIGDFLYNPSDETMGRQALHVGELNLIHPITKEALLLKAPLPIDMNLFDYSF